MKQWIAAEVRHKMRDTIIRLMNDGTVLRKDDNKWNQESIIIRSNKDAWIKGKEQRNFICSWVSSRPMKYEKKKKRKIIKDDEEERR